MKHFDLSLPKQRERYRVHLAAKARLMDEGIDPSKPLPEGYDRPVVPYREGHGSVARWKKHQREGEPPCVACSEAFSRAEYPEGLDGGGYFDDLWD